MTTYDTTAIRESVNLLDLVGRDTSLRKVSGTGGGEYAGPCPKCGGRDRLHVTPSWFFCRQCHARRGDAIDYLRWRDGLDFAAACEALGVQKTALGGSGTRTAAPTGHTIPIARDAEPPSAAWQSRARQFVTYAQKELWRDPAALAYLRGRGLSDDTIRAAGLGYNPRDVRDKPDRWGLDGAPIWLPCGWVIPCEAGGTLWHVKIRRPDGATPKYVQPRGGRPALYGADTLAGHSDVILTEGEFDALLLRQHVGMLCGVATFASATARPSARDMATLATVRRLWLAYDADAAGDQGAAAFGELSARIRRLPWPFEGAKDITDAWRAGYDLIAWVVGAIGPGDPEQRRAWARRYLDALDGAAFAVQGTETDPADETAPALGVWLALLRVYNGQAFACALT